MDVGDLAPRHLRPVGSGAGLRSIEDAIEPVLCTRSFVRTGCSTQDRQVAIDLSAVGVDDDPADLLCKSESEGRLAASGRPGN